MLQKCNMEYLLYLIFLLVGIFIIYNLCSKNQDYLNYILYHNNLSLSDFSLIKEKENEDICFYSKHEKLKSLIKLKYILKHKLNNTESEILILTREIKGNDYKINYELIDKEMNDLLTKDNDLMDN